jgi:hypothetical protein
MLYWSNESFSRHPNAVVGGFTPYNEFIMLNVLLLTKIQSVVIVIEACVVNYCQPHNFCSIAYSVVRFFALHHTNFHAYFCLLHLDNEFCFHLS